jgi:hypothetical protein
MLRATILTYFADKSFNVFAENSKKRKLEVIDSDVVEIVGEEGNV